MRKEIELKDIWRNIKSLGNDIEEWEQSVDSLLNSDSLDDAATSLEKTRETGKRVSEFFSSKIVLKRTKPE